MSGAQALRGGGRGGGCVREIAEEGGRARARLAVPLMRRWT